MNAKRRRERSGARRRLSVSTETVSATPSASTLWTPEDFAAYLPDAPVISSRGTTTWQDIVVELRRQPPQELFAPASTHHLLGLVLGSPFHFRREIGGDVKAGMRLPGDTTILPAGQPRHAVWDRTAELLHIHLDREMVERVAESFIASPERIEVIPAFSVPDPQMEHIGKALLAELERGAPSGRLFGDNLAAALAAHLLRHYTAFPARIPGIDLQLVRTELRRAIEYVHDNLDRDLSLREIAAVSGVSENYLTTLFKQATGYSLYEYVIRLRVTKAKELLQKSDLSIAAIAQSVGFYDSSHLNRHFKRLMGVTPRSFRKTS